jgi:hypothetical protein
MPIDLINEQPISIAVARRKYIPRINYGPISPATASRWINKGVLAGDGTGGVCITCTATCLSGARTGMEVIRTAQ